jgi:hypothetical protein
MAGPNHQRQVEPTLNQRSSRLAMDNGPQEMHPPGIRHISQF